MAKPLVQRRLRGRINVVYAHYAGPPNPYVGAFYEGLTLERLRETLRTLGTFCGYASLDEVVATPRRPSGQPLLAVTFDDGFDLIRSGVADLLDEFGIRATSFLITSCLDNADLMWRNKLSAIIDMRRDAEYLRAFAKVTGRPAATVADSLRAAADWAPAVQGERASAIWEEARMLPLHEFLEEHRPYFTDLHVREWLDRGHRVGLHTRTHPFCARLDEDGVRREVIEPARELRARFGLVGVPFSYPFGSRLEAGAEARLIHDGVIDSAFGIEGFAPAGTPRARLERACIDGELGFAVFGRLLIGPLAQRRLSAARRMGRRRLEHSVEH